MISRPEQRSLDRNTGNYRRTATLSAIIGRHIMIMMKALELIPLSLLRIRRHRGDSSTGFTYSCQASTRPFRSGCRPRPLSTSWAGWRPCSPRPTGRCSCGFAWRGTWSSPEWFSRTLAPSYRESRVIIFECCLGVFFLNGENNLLST